MESVYVFMKTIPFIFLYQVERRAIRSGFKDWLFAWFAILTKNEYIWDSKSLIVSVLLIHCFELFTHDQIQIRKENQQRRTKKTISYKRIMLRHHLNAAQKMNKQFVFKLNYWKFNSILSVFYWEIFVFSAFVCSSLLILCTLHTLTHIMFALNLISYYPFNGGRDVRFVKVCKQSKMI